MYIFELLPYLGNSVTFYEMFLIVLNEINNLDKILK